MATVYVTRSHVHVEPDYLSTRTEGKPTEPASRDHTPHLLAKIFEGNYIYN